MDRLDTRLLYNLSKCDRMSRMGMDNRTGVGGIVNCPVNASFTGGAHGNRHARVYFNSDQVGVLKAAKIGSGLRDQKSATITNAYIPTAGCLQPAFVKFSTNGNQLFSEHRTPQIFISGIPVLRFQLQTSLCPNGSDSLTSATKRARCSPACRRSRMSAGFPPYILRSALRARSRTLRRNY